MRAGLGQPRRILHPDRRARIQRFLALTIRQKSLLVLAWLLLGWYRAALWLLPFRRITARLQHSPAIAGPPALQPEQRAEALMIGSLVSAASRFTPWNSTCLTQVLVVQRLLAIRNIPGEFHLGARRGREPGDDAAGLCAHAWLCCGDDVVCGASGHEQYTILSTLRW